MRAVLPRRMRAMLIEDQRLVPAQRPVPKPKRGEVLIRVTAAGVNRPDLLQRKGLYPPPKGASDIPGLEVSGTIAAVGAGVKGFKTGMAVCALLAGGGYAEFCAVPAVQCLPLPAKMDIVAAAGMPENYFTVWTNVFDRAALKKGESILIHGGASGIGTTAIQMATAFGATVYTTAGSAEKCAACETLGARRAYNYKTQDFAEALLRDTKGKNNPGGVDVVLDMVGGDYLPRNISVLKPEGRHVSIAVQRGRKAEIDIAAVMAKRLVLTGSTLRARRPEEKGLIAKALRRAVWPLLARRKMKVIIDRIFPLEAAQAAHDYLESGQHIGKVILRV